MTRGISLLLPAMLLVVVTLAVYVPALNGGFLWSDDWTVSENETLRRPDGLGTIWTSLGPIKQYYPLLYTSWWLDYRLWGLRPFGYHLENVLLHALGAVLLWRVLLRLKVPGAWVAAGLFALHPVQVESVAWISERKNVLSGAFYLGSLLAFLRSGAVSAAPPDRTRFSRWSALSLVLFLGALLSKTVTCTLPVVLLLLIWWQRGRLARRDLILPVPMLILGGALGGVTAWLERHQTGALGPEWDLTLLERCLVAGRAFWFYLGKLIWPVRLSLVYPRWEVATGGGWQYGFPLAALGLFGTLWLLRRRIGRAPFTALACFGVTLTPALGFFDIYYHRYSYVADHWQYLAMLGPMVLVASLGARRLGRWAGPVSAVLLVVLAGLSWNQAKTFRTEEISWRRTLEQNPTAWVAHTNLGLLMEERGELDQAIRHYREAIRCPGDHPEPHNNLGGALSKQGRIQEARTQYERSLAIHPGYSLAHGNLGLLLARSGDLAGAERHFRQALAIRPNYPEARNGLAGVLASRGEREEAIRQLRRAVELDPDFREARGNLDRLLRIEAGRPLTAPPSSD